MEEQPTYGDQLPQIKMQQIFILNKDNYMEQIIPVQLPNTPRIGELVSHKCLGILHTYIVQIIHNDYVNDEIIYILKEW